MTWTCDNASVGVLISDAADRWLLLHRATPPAGIAPCAGHVFDDHAVRTVDGQIDATASYRAAAVAEVREELGLTVTAESLALVASGWRTAACRRRPGPRGVGHDWRVYHAPATGTLAPSTRETKGARWYTRPELQALAERTADYARGRLTDADFTAAPGIEPVWCQWLHETSLIRLAEDALDVIDDLLTTRARRLTRVPVQITHTAENGTVQTLWAEVDDWEYLAALQDLCHRKADAVFTLYARLTPDGTDYPRVFRAARTTLTELER